MSSPTLFALLSVRLCAGIPSITRIGATQSQSRYRNVQLHFRLALNHWSPQSKKRLKENMRRCLVHFHHAALSSKKIEDHFDAFPSQNSILRAELYARASAPLEGSSLDIEHALIQARQHWPLALECPVIYTSERVESCLKKSQGARGETGQLEDMRGMLGTDATGWVADDDYLAQAQEMRKAMMLAFLKECETGSEGKAVLEHFTFDDRYKDE
ncbi:hypothetical protein AC578_6933 [Pseudocercospora eumusae]|uniref:Uncharacterized protein n=1 Tax=Pseudocercospora eumusae TaxID=321146 RepID=A0A139GYI9_9PEZI|nr:hypothetical protein AC578_6933 [Pseudocercospora eumusae]